MKLFFLRCKRQIQRFGLHLTLCSLLCSTVLFAFIKTYRTATKSDEEVGGRKRTNEIGVKKNFTIRWHSNENIVEYLHKLHKMKGSGGVQRTESGQLQPFYTVKQVFYKADVNGDHYLNSDEISTWIQMKTQEHIRQSIADNYKTFITIDVHPKNGYISWEEYYAYFLQKNGYNETTSTSENEYKNLKRNMSRKMKEAIMRDRAAFSESAKTYSNLLDLDEFLSFTHPESSYSTIIYLVDEILKKFDRDEDDILTEDEFSSLQVDDDYGREETINQEEEERRKEFREMVDSNKDGKATKKELLTYVDPKNPRHAREEAEILVELADIDKDGRLSLLEIFNKMDLFLGSKMIDTARSFHDEL